jgi:asparaginyl-tRNA synthetase
MGLGKVWTLSPTFRAEKSVTSRHLAEFWMLEAEYGADELTDVTTVVEKVIRCAVQQLARTEMLSELTTTIKGQDNTIPVQEIPERWERMALDNWTRMTYDDAIDILLNQHARRPFDIPPERGAQLQSSHEQYLASQSATPVFVTHYPAEIKPFYMLRSQSNPNVVENFDLLVPGMGEIAGGSLRIHDIQELERSMRRNGMDESELDWYTDLRRWGSIPHGGFGLGFDRLIGYLAGVTNLREVVAFPRMFGKSGCLN